MQMLCSRSPEHDWIPTDRPIAARAGSSVCSRTFESAKADGCFAPPYRAASGPEPSVSATTTLVSNGCSHAAVLLTQVS
jgi:hypothetical protein